MDSSKTSAILIAFLLSLYSTAPIVSGGYCPPSMHKPPRSKHQRPRFPGGPPTGKPPVTVPPVIGNPPITFPPIIGGPPVTGPPGVGVPPGTIPPGNTPTVPSPGAPGSTTTCPVDAIRIGACVDLLGGLVHVVIGDPAANQCCPLLRGLLELEAAVCLCTSIRLRLLSINIYLPLALQLLITCGITPPPGFTCTVN